MTGHKQTLQRSALQNNSQRKSYKQISISHVFYVFQSTHHVWFLPCPFQNEAIESGH